LGYTTNELTTTAAVLPERRSPDRLFVNYLGLYARRAPLSASAASAKSGRV
jgi:hypothetical protein